LRQMSRPENSMVRASSSSPAEATPATAKTHKMKAATATAAAQTRLQHLIPDPNPADCIPVSVQLKRVYNHESSLDK
jgi:hypothetical protein